MHSEHSRQPPVSAWLTHAGVDLGSAGLIPDVVSGQALTPEARSDLQDRVLVRELARALRGLSEPPTGAEEPTAFDPDATAIEIVTRGLDPELRAAADADPHGTVLPRGGITFAELDDLLASLVALAVHTATTAADRCGSTAEEIVATAALRLRSA